MSYSDGELEHSSSIYPSVQHSSLIYPSFEPLYDEAECSTSESGMSNTFLDEVLTGLYENWDYSWSGIFLGRYTTVSAMQKTIFHLQSNPFWPTAGKHYLDQLLMRAEMDIVQRDKRFPLGSYIFLDGELWTKIITDLYTIFHTAQEMEVNFEDILRHWTLTINNAIGSLQYSMNRDNFERDNKLTWLDVKQEFDKDPDRESENVV